MGHAEFVTQQLYRDLREADHRFSDERDRRYAEVKNAEEKALKVKEQADRDALGLAREIQTYKDEKANELRSQIERERGTYISRAEFKPVGDFIATQTGRASGALDMRTLFLALPGVIAAILTIFLGAIVLLRPTP
jgi:vacuolar-type H+-ATPase subunit H